MAKQQTFETDNQKYVFQHPGIQFSEQMKDDSRDQNGKFMPHKYYKKIMESVIVEPKVDFSYFDELEGAEEEKVQPDETEYTLVHPGTKTTAEMEYHMMNGKGVPSEVSTKEQLMKHIIKVDGKEVSFKYFDEKGDIEEYNEVIDAASSFFRDTEFKKVMDAAGRFLRGKQI